MRSEKVNLEHEVESTECHTFIDVTSDYCFNFVHKKRFGHTFLNFYLLPYEDILTKFAKNVYCYKNMSVKNFGPVLNST